MAELVDHAKRLAAAIRPGNMPVDKTAAAELQTFVVAIAEKVEEHDEVIRQIQAGSLIGSK